MVDIADIEDIFAPFARVSVKRMFSGHGVFADDLFFAMVNKGEVYLKTDEANVERFVAAGSKPFMYRRSGRGEIVSSLWTIPPSAFEHDEEFREWARSALDVARRNAAVKRPAARKTKPPGTTASRANQRKSGATR